MYKLVQSETLQFLETCEFKRVIRGTWPEGTSYDWRAITDSFLLSGPFLLNKHIIWILLNLS